MEWPQPVSQPSSWGLLGSPDVGAGGTGVRGLFEALQERKREEGGRGRRVDVGKRMGVRPYWGGGGGTVALVVRLRGTNEAVVGRGGIGLPRISRGYRGEG